ncbi:MAG: tRNA (adenosine(37)-N6)-threonylcarbamoyltransferase complex ATPase subunit type 1 TsaE [Magnetococcales bacterium]|nr:tRNA (adenosine(37)-N6)-threonylcarbamoyltransferase complex ATPase subunit type 1 TsaE [Magnetococcales bacterium]
MAEQRFTTRSEDETEQFGSRMAELLHPGSVIVLEGDLGAGKTVVARGIVRGLGSNKESVTSPTFTLMNPYPDGRLPVWHWDLYRLGDPEELDLIGAEEYLGVDGVTLIEWKERGGDRVPTGHLIVQIDYDDEDPEIRLISLSATDHEHGKIVDELDGYQ